MIVPRIDDVRSAMKKDKDNGNQLWFEAQTKEADILLKMEVFELKPEDFDLTGYQYVPLIYTWDVKFDDQRSARLVASNAVTIGPLDVKVWLGVLNTDSVKTVVFLGMLNNVKTFTADISLLYLMADTKELMYTRLSPDLVNRQAR